MGIKKTIEVLNAMQADGVIGRYAIAGAVAAYNYIEPAVTHDLDILLAFEDASASALVNLQPIFSYLAARGYTVHRGEGLLVEGWPVQFLPITDDLQQEALAEAQEIELRAGGGEPASARLLKPEHLVAICLRVGRPKDLLRIVQFLEAGAVDVNALCSLLSRHNLRSPWQIFCARMSIADPCDSARTQ
jgi:hypothetical protein